MVKLRVGKQPHKVRRVARLHVVALEVQRDIAEGDGVAVNVERADGGADVLAVGFGLVDLALEVLGKVRGC